MERRWCRTTRLVGDIKRVTLSRPNGTPCMSRTGCLGERVRMEGMSLCSWWFRPSELRKYSERCTMGVLVLILESTRRFLKLGSVAGKTVVTRINDVVYKFRRGPKRKMKIVHFGRFIKYNSNTVVVSDRDDQN